MTNNQWTSITSVGGLLPQDFLSRIASGDKELEGLRPEDYHLSGERPAEAIPRAWNRLRGVWTSFAAEREKLGGAGGALTGLTREKWLLPLFDALSFGRLSPAKAVTIDDDPYPVSHRWENVPIHLMGAGLDLDKRQKGERGAAAMSPHSLMQVLLNRDPNSLWGIVSNGLRLRVLRDSASLTRQAFIEFDLEAMFAGELYADFALLWLTVHQSRFEAKAGEACWLERWLQAAKSTGIRALDDLRRGVEEAIKALGQGFLSDLENRPLRDALKGGALTPHGYYQQLLRLVYRLIFVMVAEARGLLLDPAAPTEAHDRYKRYYALERLRDLARRPTSGPRHGDLYEQVKLVMGLLAGRGDAGALGLSVLNGFLFSETTTPHLDAARLANGAFLEALRALCYTTEKDGRVRPVDFRTLGAEELGSVYESLLELVPEVDSTGAAFNLINAQGNDRKTTGSYYTPTSLITLLLDSALEPVIAQALKQKDKETALLALRVIDPACGSGHFLVAAAQRLARHLASVRTGEPEPPPAALQHALRDVVRRCIYGVDVNPMSIELAKVGLWLEALEPGKPLTFLDHHLRAGNSLIGLGPGQTVDEIPDEAFTAVAGDDKKVATTVKKLNQKHRKGGQLGLGFGATLDAAPAREALTRERLALEAMPDDTPEQIAAKARAFAEAERSPDYARLKAEADLWTAAFFWPLTADAPLDMAPTQGALLDLRTGNPSLFLDAILKATAQVCTQIGALHWPLAFPEVAEAGGFDVVLGNPPWDLSQFNEIEFFAARDPDIAALPGSRRKQAIDQLQERAANLYRQFEVAKRNVSAANLFFKESCRLSLTAVGKMNTYALFSEHFRSLLAPHGRAGLIVPTGIATDDTTKAFFGDVTATRTLVQLLDFENREAVFPAVHRSYKFCLLTLSGQATTQAAFVFFATRVEHTADAQRRFSLSADDIARFNPNTRTMPIFRTAADAELTGKIYARVPVLENEATGENPWDVMLKQGLFNMTSDSHLFKTAPGEGLVPLYEAKLMHQYDHRWATYVGDEVRDLSEAEKADPGCTITPRYWVPQAEVDKALTKTDRAGNVLWQWTRGWLLGWRDIARATDERTAIFSVLPRVGVGHTMPLFFSDAVPSAFHAALFLAAINSVVVDYCARQKVGGTHLSYNFLEQFPILSPAAYTQIDKAFIVPRVVELVYTAHDLAPFVEDLLAEVGVEQWATWFPNHQLVDGKPQPFRWDPARRAVLRAELDAYYAKLYGLTRDELRYILDPADVHGPDFPGETFRVLKERELREYGEYRTRRLVLEAWDRSVDS
jgi:hypothetical protein